MTDIIKENKVLLLRFHIGDVTIDDLAEGLNMPNKKAYELYKDNIKAIVEENKKAKLYNLGGKKEDAPKAEAPKPEEPKPDVAFKEKPGPSIAISPKIVNDLISSSRALVIEDVDFATEVGLFLADDDAEAVARIGKDDLDDLPSIGIASSELIPQIKAPCILVTPTYDEKTDTIRIQTKDMN